MENGIKFYEAKWRIGIKAVLSIVLTIVFGILSYKAYGTEDDVFEMVIISIMVLFLIMAVINIRRYIFPKPYIVLTDNFIILQHKFGKMLEIEWDDISGFRVHQFTFKSFVHVSLYNKEVYHMSKDAKIDSVHINWQKFKKLDRMKLIKEIECKTKHTIKGIEEAFQHVKDEKNAYRKIGFWYFFRAYLISLVIFLFLLIMTNMVSNVWMLALYFFIFPFAKVIFDLWIGFTLVYKWDKELNVQLSNIIAILLLVGYIVCFFISPVIAPFGLSYIAAQFYIKKRE